MKAYSYLDLLALVGVGSAHPGGFSLTKELLPLLSLPAGADVLDAGCGTGRTAVYAADVYGWNVTAIDQNAIMTAKAKRRSIREGVPVHVLQGSIEHLPFTDGAFRGILAESVIIFTNVPQTLRELYRTLHEHGRLLAIEMTVERPLTAEEAAEIRAVYGIQSLLTEEQWQEQLQQAGFSHTAVIGGGTIAKAAQSYGEQPDWDLSPHITPEVYNVWIQHEAIIQKYQHVLGHRIFLAQK